MTDVTVLISVGPKPHHRRWLTEAIDSVRAQTVKVAEILIIFDGPPLPHLEGVGDDIRLWPCPWPSGPLVANNFGVALARSELVLFLASDDRLMPWCIADCLQEFERRHRDLLGYYALDIEYSDGTGQSLPSGAAMVSKTLWHHNGGFPIEASVGACDHIFVNCLLMADSKAGRIWQVHSAHPPYWHRLHDEMHTREHGERFRPAIGIVRDILGREWRERWSE